jgi:hypothetical protein
MSVHEHRLAPPPAVADPRSFEILRVWAARGEQHVTIHSGLNGGPEEFGYMVAQLLRHGANIFQQRDGMDPEEALARIRAGFDRELDSPTGDVTGEIPE